MQIARGDCCWRLNTSLGSTWEPRIRRWPSARLRPRRSPAASSVCGIPQLVNANEVAERSLLPSFLYVPGEFDFPQGSLALPWDAEPQFVIGELARKRGAESPTRLVASAKSWLSNAAADRTAPILPWQAPDEVPKLSPVEASSQYLQYLRTVWDAGEAGQAACALPSRKSCSPSPPHSTKKPAS